MSGCRRTVGESEETKAPRHYTQRDFLSTLPVWAVLRRIVLSPVLDELPKHLGKGIITGSPVHTHQRIRECEATRFPNNFYVAGTEIANITPVTITWQLLPRQAIAIPGWRIAGANRQVFEVSSHATFKVARDVVWMYFSDIPLGEER